MTTHQIFEVRVAGLVPNAALLELGNIEVADQELRTVITGRFQDQAALYGLLHRLRSLGLDVVEVRQVARVPEAGTESVETPVGVRQDDDESPQAPT